MTQVLNDSIISAREAQISAETAQTGKIPRTRSLQE
jgi:hypothetical protein